MKLNKRKGMTLMECMIALAISALLASLMVSIMTAVNGTMKRTVSLNRRLAHESKYADNLVTADDAGDFAHVTKNVTIQFGGVNTITATGTQYTAHYTDPHLVDGFDKSADYRFMSFKKIPAASPHAANVFWLKIVLSADLTSKITQIDVAGSCYSHTLDPLTTDYKTQTCVTTDTIKDISLDPTGGIDFSQRMANGKTLIEIPVDSDVPNGTIKLAFHKDMIASDGTHFDNYKFEDVTLTYCTQVAKPSGTTQYYTETVYEFDGVDFAIQE